ncbi:MAG TPA: DNA double-strand break repair nuclease NurA [Dehalococcoidia bacterium]|nr:DNA double-strand break repair nuclease NurA [Dehalococcoidia bacterium]
MTLPLERLAESLPRIRDEALFERTRAVERRANALSALRAASDVEAVTQRVEDAITSWLVAVPLEPPTTRHPRPPSPGVYTILAVDGSHAELDRFAATSCAVINLGGWRIQYGRNAQAELLRDLRVLTSQDLDCAERDDASRVEMLSGQPLGALRTVEELRFLEQAAAEALSEPDSHPVVGLLDGSLVLWSVSTRTQAARRRIIDEGVIPALNKLRQLAQLYPFAFCGYISHPGSTEVVNMLRVQPNVCYRPSNDRVECQRCEQRADDGSRPCDLVAINDRALFAALLAPGERSAAFRSVSKNKDSVQNQSYEPAGHAVAFCYVRVGVDEVARLEFPLWLAAQPGALDLLHAAVLDQCERGPGYPIALQEAHELAVLTGPDRMTIERLIEDALQASGVPTSVAGKRGSKRWRMI